MEEKRPIDFQVNHWHFSPGDQNHMENLCENEISDFERCRRKECSRDLGNNGIEESGLVKMLAGRGKYWHL